MAAPQYRSFVVAAVAQEEEAMTCHRLVLAKLHPVDHVQEPTSQAVALP
jgi:hypothetical protein